MQGLHNMLQNQSKLIFIRTPGSKKALNMYCKLGEGFAKKLREAMNVSRTRILTEETEFRPILNWQSNQVGNFCVI